MTIYDYTTGNPIRVATVDEITVYGRMFDLQATNITGAVDGAAIGAEDLAGVIVWLD